MSSLTKNNPIKEKQLNTPFTKGIQKKELLKLNKKERFRLGLFELLSQNDHGINFWETGTMEIE